MHGSVTRAMCRSVCDQGLQHLCPTAVPQSLSSFMRYWPLGGHRSFLWGRQLVLLYSPQQPQQWGQSNDPNSTNRKSCSMSQVTPSCSVLLVLCMWLYALPNSHPRVNRSSQESCLMLASIERSKPPVHTRSYVQMHGSVFGAICGCALSHSIERGNSSELSLCRRYVATWGEQKKWFGGWSVHVIQLPICCDFYQMTNVCPRS